MLSKAQVLEGEVILGQYLATENVEQVNDLFSHLWIKLHLYFLIIFVCFAAESKIQKMIFNHTHCNTAYCLMRKIFCIIYGYRD